MCYANLVTLLLSKEINTAMLHDGNVKMSKCTS